VTARVERDVADESGSRPDRAVDAGNSVRRMPLVPAMLLVLLLVGGMVLSLAGIRGWALACVGSALLLSLHLTSSLLTDGLVVVTVRGTSMEPAYHDGDRVIVRRGRTPRVGQVVVVERPDGTAGWRTRAVPPAGGARAVTDRHWFIKRVVAVPGDRVPRDEVPALADLPEDRVPAGKVVLLGDNQEVSLDSRRLGYFPAERVLGTVLWSLSPS
jgi:signal peptidase I